MEFVAALCFALAVAHTLLVRIIQEQARRYREGSVGENLFHLLGEVEVVFGLWATVFLLCLGIHGGAAEAIHYLESCRFSDPAFVFVIMTVCATRPILTFATSVMDFLSKLLPFPRALSFYVTTLGLGPLLGSFITEPAAMTVCALILLEKFFTSAPERLKYATLGLLFVSISIGGTLTPYAAPPILMVARKWNWDLFFLLGNFGWKAALAIALSTAAVAWRYRKDLARISLKKENPKNKRIPAWVTVTHLISLVFIVLSSHHPVLFTNIFLFFLGLVSVTREYQNELKLREGLLVAFFLGGLVVLGGPQRWWLEPLLTRLEAFPLYLGSIFLTSLTDNAALTFLGSQVPHLSESSRYALVAGSVVGGGLTIIANAPNPAGYGILNPAFGPNGINPLKLFRGALLPTLISALCFWIL